MSAEIVGAVVATVALSECDTLGFIAFGLLADDDLAIDGKHLGRADRGESGADSLRNPDYRKLGKRGEGISFAYLETRRIAITLAYGVSLPQSAVLLKRKF
jgi:hypothetical protein